jgi:hypothetical protein
MEMVGTKESTYLIWFTIAAICLIIIGRKPDYDRGNATGKA